MILQNFNENVVNAYHRVLPTDILNGNFVSYNLKLDSEISLRRGAFMSASITNFYADKITSIDSMAFQNCNSLKTVEIIDCAMISDYAFRSCTNLEMASFPKCSRISLGAFHNCKNLISLYLFSNKVVSLFKNALDGSGLLNNKGTIYVPSQLLSQYKKAVNWSACASHIKGV